MVRLGGGVWEGTVPTLRAEAKRGDNEPHIQIHNGEPTMAVRRLTPLECEKLMGWKPKVLSVRLNICSDSQRNPAPVGTSNPKLPDAAGHAEQNQLTKLASSVVSPSSANLAKTSKPVAVSARINLEAGHIRLTNEQTGQEYVASIVRESSKKDNTMVSQECIAQMLVLMNIALDNSTQHGRVASLVRKTDSVKAKNGVPLLTLYGSEIGQLANIVQSNIEKTPADFMSTMLLHTQNTQQDDWILKTLFCYAMNAIGGYIPGVITAEFSYQIDLSISHGHTQLKADGTEQADTHRYKQCGNGVASPVAQWIAKHILAI